VKRVEKFIVFIILVGLGLSFYFINSLQKEIITLKNELSETYYTLAKARQNEAKILNHAVIFLVKSTPTDFFLVPVNREISEELTPFTALNCLLLGPLPTENWLASVPSTTKLIGLSIFEGLATVNFSNEIQIDFNGGALLESLMIQAIVNTLTEFPEIKSVQILVNGEVVESIGGHIFIAEPLSRNNN